MSLFPQRKLKNIVGRYVKGTSPFDITVTSGRLRWHRNQSHTCAPCKRSSKSSRHKTKTINQTKGSFTSVQMVHTHTLLHTNTFTHRPSYTQTETFTHKPFYTQTLSHRNPLTHRSCDTRTPFTHRPSYTQTLTLLHSHPFTSNTS